MPQSFRNKIFDFSRNRYLIAYLFEIVIIELGLIRDESEVELKIGVLELVSIALFIDFICCFFGIALDNCVEVF